MTRKIPVEGLEIVRGCSDLEVEVMKELQAKKW